MARARQRAEFACLVEVLAPVGWQGDERSVEAWVLRLRELPDDEGAQLARNLLRAYRHGMTPISLEPARKRRGRRSSETVDES
ncbi:hypothetical protein OV203_06010 [Nannocystis sp. ILAH1]|uniref:hypothetical protein n=1 Tax=unclassified Nannocystis TaxID=2627009 RepID=UPI0022706D31|nr:MULTISPECIES: hypothetical protein [unclassified Nannocystis]MCY0986665.1 hypothetical protein [Nannocystis sp. ILAH1]MCY1071545.1 hypothetical protein [Nannocystis sp. RBIL2]